MVKRISRYEGLYARRGQNPEEGRQLAEALQRGQFP